MYQGLLHLHSLLRWIILILLVVNIVRHFTASNKPFTATDKKLGPVSAAAIEVIPKGIATLPVQEDSEITSLF